MFMNKNVLKILILSKEAKNQLLSIQYFITIITYIMYSLTNTSRPIRAQFVIRVTSTAITPFSIGAPPSATDIGVFLTFIFV